MKLRRTWFLAASARSSASAAASLTGSGNSIAWRRAMERGTMLSISARREVSPITDSIRAWSSASMPIWRGRGWGDDVVDQRAARGLPDHRQHPGLVVGIDADMAGQEFGGVFQCTERYRMLRSRWHRHGAVSKKGSQAQAVLA